MKKYMILAVVAAVSSAAMGTDESSMSEAELPRIDALSPPTSMISSGTLQRKDDESDV